MNELFDTVAPTQATGEGYKSAKKSYTEAYAFAVLMRTALGTVGIPAEDVHFAGSLRRQKSLVGDLDIVWVGNNGKTTYQILLEVLQMEGYTTTVKQMGECFLSVQVNDFLIEFKRADSYNLGGFLLFSTGPAEYNKSMRRYSLARGLHLSQYGLAEYKVGPKSKMDYFNGETEHGIYAALGLIYEKPEDRVEFRAPDLIEPECIPQIPVVIWNKLPEQIKVELRSFKQPRLDSKGIPVPVNFLWSKQSRHSYYKGRGVFKIQDLLKLDRY